MDKKIFVMAHATARANAKRAIDAALDGWVVTIKPPTRNLDQNAALWPLLGEISRQVDWYGNKLGEEEWKCIFTAALKRQKVVPGIEGGFVAIGEPTRTMSKREFSDLLDLATAFAIEKNVTLR